MLPALAFLPTEDVTQGFTELQPPPALEGLAEYFEENFIGLQQRRRRIEPRFGVEKWNMRAIGRVAPSV